MDTGARAYIHQEICRPHGVLVMLHHDQCVAQVPQPCQSLQQLVVVPLMQADAGLVQNIQHTHERRADLRCQTDALGLAAGKGPCRTGKGQILQAHALQEAQSGADLPQDLLCNDRLGTFQREVIQEFQFLLYRQVAELRDGQAADRHCPGDLRQAFTAAAGTGRGGHILLQFLAHGVRLGLTDAPLDVGDDTLKGLLQSAAAVAPLIVKLQLFPLGPV